MTADRPRPVVILVCGGREYSDREFLYMFLDSEGRVDLLIEGGARGADRLAREWALSRGVHVATVNAQWDKFGGGAGPLRNHAMTLLKPTRCIAFPGGRGTGDMVRRCKNASIPAIVLGAHE